jgi:hypothetical protein
MITKYTNLLKLTLLISTVMFCFSCNEYIPNGTDELNGHILTDSDGKRYKLEWVEGNGESWRFLEEVKSKTDSSRTQWIYVSKRTFYK